MQERINCFLSSKKKHFEDYNKWLFLQKYTESSDEKEIFVPDNFDTLYPIDDMWRARPFF